MTLLRLEDPRALEKAIAVLQNGGVIAFPTDTVYGIGASLDFPEALDRIYASKMRDRSRTLPVLLGSSADLEKVTRNVDPDLVQLAANFWPGPLTVALPARDSLPEQVVAADGTVGVRIPDHSIALALAQRCGGALAVTSANLSGQPPAQHAEDIDADLVSSLDLVLDGGIARGGQASTVIRLEGDTISIVRVGVIPSGHIDAIWGQIRSAANAKDGSATAGTIASDIEARTTGTARGL